MTCSITWPAPFLVSLLSLMGLVLIDRHATSAESVSRGLVVETGVVDETDPGRPSAAEPFSVPPHVTAALEESRPRRLRRLAGLPKDTAAKSSQDCSPTGICRLDIGSEAGVDWLVSDLYGEHNVPGQVPGVVMQDLLAAGLISDPYYRFNDDAVAWVGRREWIYTGRLLPNPGWSDRLWLQLEGLDTIAAVFVDGSFVGASDNMFLPKLISLPAPGSDPTSALLELVFLDPIEHAGAVEAAYPYKVPVADVEHSFPHRNFIRKSQANFGWDWGPPILSTGPYLGGAMFAANSSAAPCFWQSWSVAVDGTPTLGWSLHIHTMIFCDLDQSVDVAVSLAGFGSLARFDWAVSGWSWSWIEAWIPVEADVDLWWPVGYGKQPLYDVTLTLEFPETDQDALDDIRTVGFRTVALMEDPAPDGALFYFRVNEAHDVFLRGSNTIPLDVMEPRVTPAAGRHLIDSALASHQNTLRVWGGGVYYPSEFYEYADEVGLLVWQDYMFACALYPIDPVFLASVRAEVLSQTRRLMSHPSIFLWAANNENEGALTWFDESVTERDRYLVDYVRLYIDTIRDAVKTADPSRPFLHSSPTNGDLVEFPYVARFGDAQSEDFGDIHFYDYESDCTDVRSFRHPRFASEYGYQSLPSFAAWSQISVPADWTVGSPLYEHRQQKPGGSVALATQLAFHFRTPDWPSDPVWEYDCWHYLTQAVQARCYKSQTEHYRRRGPNSTMGALYWQLNDIWQGPSWSSIEWSGGWKILHNYATEFFAPFGLTAHQGPDGLFELWAVNDIPENLRVYGGLEVVSWANGQPVCEVALPAVAVGQGLEGSALLGAWDLDELAERVCAFGGPFDASRYYLVGSATAYAGECRTDLPAGSLSTDSEPGKPDHQTETAYWPAPLAQVQLQPVKLTVAVEDGGPVGRSVSMDVSGTGGVAPLVWLESSIPGYFRPNGFLLTPGPSGVVKSIFRPVDPGADLGSFAATLSVRCLQDAYESLSARPHTISTVRTILDDIHAA